MSNLDMADAVRVLAQEQRVRHGGGHRGEEAQ